MDKEFNYFVIEPLITKRTPLLMNDGKVDPNGINFLYHDAVVAQDYVAHLQFLMNLKNPDMNIDYLKLEGYGVFSGKIYNALKEYMPINSLQLVEAVINEDNEEYKDFWIANIYQTIRSFDEKSSFYKKINRRGEWIGIKKIVLDKKILSEIPLEKRLVFEAKEDCAFTLYHESIIDIIKSTDPKGMHFIPIEQWNSGIAFDFLR